MMRSHRNGWFARLAVAFLCLLSSGGANAVTPGLEVEPRENPSQGTFVALFEDGRIETSSFRDGADDPPARDAARGWWISRGRSVPYWIERGADSGVPPSVIGTVKVEVPRKPSGAPIGGQLVVAPVRMWEQVPEALLPRWPTGGSRLEELNLHVDEPVRMRWFGDGRSSDWLEVAFGRSSPVQLREASASDIATLITDESSRGLKDGELTLLERTVSGDRRVASWRSDANGRVVAPSVPPGPFLFRASAGTALPEFFRAKSSRIPARISLRSGCLLALQFVGGKGDPRPGVRAVARSFASGHADEVIERVETSDASGRVTFLPLPAAQVVVEASAAGLATARQELDLESCPRSLVRERWEMEPARTLEVLVVSDVGRSITDARIRGGNGEEGRTNEQGLAKLVAQPSTKAVDLIVTAPRHGSSSATVSATEARARIVLSRRSLAVGTFLRTDDSVPLDPRIRVKAGRRYAGAEVETDGSFEVEIEASTVVELEFSGSDVRPVTVQVEAGGPGTVKNLGVVRASSGVMLKGLLLGTPTGEAIVGAVVACPKPKQSSSAAAWAMGELLRTSSGPDGSFVLRGLENLPTRARIVASGWSAQEIDVVPDPGVDELDLGVIWLTRGRILHVLSDVDTGTVRVDPRRQWNETEMLQARLIGGEAFVEDAPIGDSLLSVVDDRGKLRCDRTIRIPAAEAEEPLEVRCDDARVRVHGRVTVGGQPSGEGRLQWTSGSAPDGGGLILHTGTPTGLSRTSVLGAGRPAVTTIVNADGFYESSELSPGVWSVLWFDAGGGASRPLEAHVPEARESEVPLAFGGGSVSGIVVDPDGNGVEGARVQQVGGSGFAVSSAGGSFTMLGMEGERVGVQARLRELRSEVVEVDLGADSADSVVLELREDADDELKISTRGADGEPVSTLVVVEASGQLPRILSTGSDGAVSAQVGGLEGALVRAAAAINGVWTLGEWQSLEESRANGLLLSGTDGATLSVTAGDAGGALQLISASGWDLATLYRLLGVSLRFEEGKALIVAGVPIGSYLATFGGVTTRVEVDSARFQEIVLAPSGGSEP